MDEMSPTSSPQEKTDMKQYYILGVVVLIAIAVAGYMLRPKSLMAPSTTSTEPEVMAPITPTPTPGPITKLDCDTEFYNPKIGFAEYYLTVEGGDVTGATSVTCNFTVRSTPAKEILANASVTSPLTDSPQRGGSTFRCTTQALPITPRVATTVDIVLTDNLGKTASCSAPFVFPAP